LKKDDYYLALLVGRVGRVEIGVLREKSWEELEVRVSNSYTN